MNLRRFFTLVTTSLCAFTFLFATADAEAAKAKPKAVGTLKVSGGKKVLINGKPAGNGTVVMTGDTVENNTSQAVTITGPAGKVTIEPNTKLIFFVGINGLVQYSVIYGEVSSSGNLASNSSGDTDGDFANTNSYTPALGFGNSGFGGGSSGGQSSSGGVPITQVLADGRIAFVDSITGAFIHYAP